MDHMARRFRPDTRRAEDWARRNPCRPMACGCPDQLCSVCWGTVVAECAAGMTPVIRCCCVHSPSHSADVTDFCLCSAHLRAQLCSHGAPARRAQSRCAAGRKLVHHHLRSRKARLLCHAQAVAELEQGRAPAIPSVRHAAPATPNHARACIHVTEHDQHALLGVKSPLFRTRISLHALCAKSFVGSRRAPCVVVRWR